MATKSRKHSKSSTPKSVTPGSPWRFDANALTLTYRDNSYQVDLETCRTSAEPTDWIFAVAGKGWISTEDIGFLVQDLEALLMPLGTLCSLGKEKGPIDVEHVIAENMKRSYDRTPPKVLPPDRMSRRWGVNKGIPGSPA